MSAIKSKLKEVFEWRHPVQSSVVLSCGILLYIVVILADHSVISLLLKVCVMVMLLSAVHKVYLENSVPRRDFALANPERVADEVLDWVTPKVAVGAQFITDIVFWEDWWRTSTVLAFSFLTSWIASYVSVGTVMILGWVSLFCLPYTNGGIPPQAKEAAPKPTPTPTPAVLPETLPKERVVTTRAMAKDLSPPNMRDRGVIRPFGEGACPITKLPYIECTIRGVGGRITKEDRVLFYEPAMCKTQEGWVEVSMVVTFNEIRLLNHLGDPTTAYPLTQVDKVTRDLLPDHATSAVTIIPLYPLQPVTLHLPTTPAITLLGIIDLILRQNFTTAPSIFAQLALAQAKLDSRTPMSIY
eukprot:TRINITY_DN23820_c0_g1_i1.p1 TRINITY_DN23820_c0_g1~~TRINITY_DN23820_c0_g1_i1.p1  ORF type:complete len:356 (+),score=28.97 TRINITY_DN23820_c0_g1_i1:43-1110(+)